MSNRHKLRPCLQWMPIWMLRLLNVGLLPVYFGYYVWIAVRQTVECFVTVDADVRRVDDAMVQRNTVVR